MTRGVVRHALLVGAPVIALVLGASGALANSVSCGDTIYVDTKLEADLVDCPASADAISIGADGVTLDLNGHTIDGVGGRTGVAVRFHSGVTIQNGTIREFDYGVFLDHADGNHVRNLTLTTNERGIGVSISEGNLIEKNAISDSELDGIQVDLSGGNLIEKNLLLRNVYGISLKSSSHDNRVTKNQVFDTTFMGIAAFDDADGNVISKNTSGGNEYGVRIQTGCDDSVLEKNETLANRRDGILVESGTTGTLVLKNTATGNASDGIRIDSAGTTLTRNVANGNTEVGIEATPGVTDGGGNRATGNGVAPCTNVACD